MDGAKQSLQPSDPLEAPLRLNTLERAEALRVGADC